MRNQNSIFTTLGASNHALEEREQHDYYATDPKAVELLLELEQFSPVIWEPACGEGHISKVLQAHGHEVISTDLVYRGFGDPEPLDFLTETLEGFEGDIITNPPYSMGLEFVQKALESVRPGGKVAMFLKVQFLEGQKRVNTLIFVLKYITRLAGFELLNRIEIKDRKTGREYK